MQGRLSKRLRPRTARTPLVERFPLLRPFPMTIFAVGAIMLAFAVLGVQTGSHTGGSRVQAPRFAQALTAQRAPASIVAGANSLRAQERSAGDE
jgi:hypothetical protein